MTAPDHLARDYPRRPREARAPITRRETAALVYVANGLTNAAIGREMDVTESTVAEHLARVYRKLGACDRAHAVALAFVGGLITDADIRRPANQPKETIR